jgi:pSer/pThr/pTyr-binding forkhead associated (FHA) protein
MIVRLVFMRKRKRVWTAQLHQTESTLGRAHGCTVRIPSAQVSRLHCRLRIENGVVTAEDLESVNGTFVNGQRIRDPEVVHPGDRLGVGPVTFVVEYELSTTSLRPLDSEEDHAVQETESDVFLVEEEGSKPELEPPLVTEADVEIVEEPDAEPKKKLKKKPPPPRSEPAEEEGDTDVETVPLAEQDEIHVSDSGTLREFLIELDEADSHPSEPAPPA